MLADHGLLSFGLTGQPLHILSLFLFAAAYLTAGADVLLQALKNLFRGRVFDENFLMGIATIGAFCIGEYPEGVAVMLFYQIGEWFQDLAVFQSRRSIAELMDIRPDQANVKDGDRLTAMDAAQVPVGALIVVKAGERIPLDGDVLEGSSSIDASALTGESLPLQVGPGDFVHGGCINQRGLLTIRVAREYGESTVAKILKLVEEAGDRKSRSERFITRFARYYTPIVVAAAILLAAIPPLVLPGALFSDWLYRALVFLVISCPCALVISVPLSFFAGMGASSRQGVLVKGSNYMEALARTDTVVLDKTGTLTKGVFRVREICPSEAFLTRLAATAPAATSEEASTAEIPADTTTAEASATGFPAVTPATAPPSAVLTEGQKVLLELAARAESSSNHPISHSLREAWEQSQSWKTPAPPLAPGERAQDKPFDLSSPATPALAPAEKAEEVAGFGVRAFL
ncbi:MAG: HAD-IC family P-type ATPase, partial [Bacillota bacterium]|nr:HAD-IC family P-type ATPase [Bacillota bacterium]